MPRFDSSTNATEAAKRAVIMAVLAKLEFVTGTLYVHDGSGTLSWGGNDYIGVGTFGGVDTVTDDLSNIARPVKLSLSGVDAGLVSETMQEVYQGRPVSLYIAFIDAETNLILAAPQVVWEGRMDSMRLSVSQGSAAIELNCEHRLRREPRIARYTDEDQRLDYPDDKFFSLLTTIKGYPGRWGASNVNYAMAQAVQGMLRYRRRS
jgi:hypothetical protein